MKRNRVRHYVRIRERNLVLGRKSLYLDIYIKGVRRYENLHLFLEPGNDRATRSHNHAVWREAERRRANKEALVLQQLNERMRQRQPASHHTLWEVLVEFREHKVRTAHSPSLVKNIDNLVGHLKVFHPDNMGIEQVDRHFLTGFIDYLATAAREQRHGGVKPLGKPTARLYLGLLAGCLKMAYSRKYIPANPWDEIDGDDRKPLRGGSAERAYLTVDELRQMQRTPLRNEAVRQAFLFACFTGLRISDISTLRWNDIQGSGNQRHLSIEMRKTKKRLNMKLNENAIKCLPPNREGELVFQLPRHLGGVNGCIKSWARRAGIRKDVSFHTRRHINLLSCLKVNMLQSYQVA